MRRKRGALIEITATPPVRRPTVHVYYSMTKSLCGTCKAAVDAKIQFRDGAVFFAKFCPSHGHEERLVSSSVEWYLDALGFIAPSVPPSATAPVSSKGCPFDCGPCASHQQRFVLAPAPAVDVAAALDLLRIPQDAEIVPRFPKTIPDVHREIEVATAERITRRDFVPSPLAHPHCFSVCPLADAMVPLARTRTRREVFESLRRPPEPGVRILRIHALMDAGDFDASRAMRCPVGVPTPQGIAPECVDAILKEKR